MRKKNEEERKQRMRCEKKFDRGVDRLVIGRKDNENGGIRVNGGKLEREREEE